MFLDTEKTGAVAHDREKKIRELRRAMQDMMIAHAAVCYKHLTPEQFAAVQKEWSQLMLTKGWLELFADEPPLKPTPRWAAQKD